MLRIRHFIGALLLACGAQAASGSSPQPGLNSVQAFDYAILSGGKVLVRLTFRDVLKAPPAVMASHYPTASIALDFAATASALGKEPIEVNQRGLRSLQVIQSGTRTRVVISLASPHLYEIDAQGRELLITLQRPPAFIRSEAAGWLSSGAPEPGHGLRNVAFERGGDGEGRVIVELSTAAMPIDVRRQGKLLIVDFPGSTLRPGLQRRLDVRDFGTAIRVIETYRLGGNVRMTIELEGPGEFAAYQVSRSLTLTPR